MRSFELRVNTHKKVCIIDITDDIENFVRQSSVLNGLCNVYVAHTTAAIIINEFEPNLEQDFITFFEKTVSKNVQWRHNSIDNNAEAHLLSGAFGPYATIPVKNGILRLGTWQRIILCEFDGPRTRNVIVSVVSND